MRNKLYLFSFPDKKKPFRDDKNCYYAFKDTRQVPNKVIERISKLQSKITCNFISSCQIITLCIYLLQLLIIN